MKVAVPVLAPILRSETQGKILALLFADPDTEISVTGLAAGATTSLPTALREIDRAEDARIVKTRRVGSTRLVQVDAANPLYEQYRDIILATYGAPAVIREELAVVDGIIHLLVFGSWAARYVGEPGPVPNDVDVLVVGEPDRQAAYEAAERAEERLHRPVQLTIRSAEAWRAGDDPFIKEIRSRPLVSLLEETAG